MAVAKYHCDQFGNPTKLQLPHCTTSYPPNAMRENKGTKDNPPTQNTALPTKRQWEKGHKQIHRLYSEEGVIGLQMGQGYIVAQSQSIRVDQMPCCRVIQFVHKSIWGISTNP